VGAVDNNGRTAKYSNRASGNYEITLAAPGTDAVVGMKPEGGAERQSGTSFAAPQVTAAAAILKSLNPELQAGDIKRILSETARKEIDVPGPDGSKAKFVIPQNVGGRVLAVDEAVFAVINEMRKAKGMGELTREEMENQGVVDAVAVTGEPGEYVVRGIVKAAGEKGTKLSITVMGENNAVGGTTTQELSGPGEVTWSVSLPKNEGTIKVTRGDNGAASLITVKGGALEGTWEFPEIMSIAGGEPFDTGAKIRMQFVATGGGYALTGSWSSAKVTVDGQKVTVLHRYGSGQAVFSGVLDGDTITGTMVDTYNGTIPWVAIRVE